MTAENARKFEQLFEVAKKTKTALLEERQSAGLFTDKNYLNCATMLHPEGGLLSEGVGLTSLLLFAIAFRDEEKVLDQADKEVLEKTILDSLKKVCQFSKNGFNATPYINAENMEGVFDADIGYTDTVTWCVSPVILARYAERRGILHIEQETKDAMMQLLAKGIKQIVDGQREDGTWGFRTEPHAARSLYFTYSVNATIADFFDYIMDEIGKDIDSNAGEGVALGIDGSVINYLDGELGYSVVDKMKACRRSLQEYLLKNCLPLLPKLAECDEMSNEERAYLGMWEHPSYTYKDKGVKKYYFNLYYVYYLIDMLTTSGADLRYAEMKNQHELKDLECYYRENQLMSGSDLKYYFQNGNEDALIPSLLEPAIYSSRTQYEKASETGKKFWDSTKSELEVFWEHEDVDVDDAAKDLLENSKPAPVIRDPALKPMALRANVNYRFYVSEEKDVAIDRLFADVCADVCLELDPTKPTDSLLKVQDLWDSVSYSLPITERAIESIVDYYDYLSKFYAEKEKEQQKPENEQTPEVVVETVIKVEKSPFELAMEQKMAEYFDAKMDEYFNRKISEYFNSAEGKRLIASAVAEAAPACVETSASGAMIDLMDVQTQKALAGQMQRLIKDMQKPKFMPREKGVEIEQLADALVEFSNTVSQLSVKKGMQTDCEYTLSEVVSKASKYTESLKKLRQALYADADCPGRHMDEIYDKIKSNLDDEN